MQGRGIQWPKYPPASGKTWPPKGSIDYDIILQLDLYYKSERKWFEVPYVQLFFSLRNKPQLCQACAPYPIQPSSGLPPHVGLPVATTSASAHQGSSAPVPQQESQRAETVRASQATRIPKLCPQLRCTPFSLSDLKQIKVDLGKFSDDPDKYTDVLQGLGQSLELDWKDVMLLLNQTLTSNEKEAALAAAQEFGDTWCLSQVHNLMSPGIRIDIPQVHRQSLAETLAGIQIQNRGLEPTLPCHQTDSTEGQLILKDKFITRSAADIRWKLQKLALGPEQSLESLPNQATLMFYNRDQEEQAERNRRDQRKAAALVTALRQADPRGSNEGKAGLAARMAKLVTIVV
ncbi:Natural cytotoxicity triggering receptor 3 ligand 1 [Plecturocebus cupreus]